MLALLLISALTPIAAAAVTAALRGRLPVHAVIAPRRTVAVAVVLSLAASSLVSGGPAVAAENDMHVLSGTVTTVGGAALANMRVSVFCQNCPDGSNSDPASNPARPWPASRWGSGARLLGEATTGASGDWSVTIAEPASGYPLVVAWDPAGDYAFAEIRSSRQWADSTGLDASLADGGTLSGRILADGGAPPAGDFILTGPGYSYMLWSGIGLVVGAGGRYRTPGLPDGDYALTYPGDLDEPYVVGETFSLGTISGGEDSVVDHHLIEYTSLSGRVTDGSGRALSGIQVIASPVGSAAAGLLASPVGGAISPVLTGEDGTYNFDSITPGGVFAIEFQSPDGEYAVEYYDDQSSSREADGVEIPLGGVSGIDAQLGPGGTVSGYVKDIEGQPVPGTGITLCPEDDANNCHYRSTDTSGFFEFGGMAAASYKLTARPSYALPPIERSVALAEGGHEQVELLAGIDEGVPGGTSGGGEQVPGDPSVVDTDVGPGTVVDGLAKVSGLRYDFGGERAVWEPVSGAVFYLLAMWDGEQSRRLNVECCSYIIYLSQSDVEHINVSAFDGTSQGPWSGWVSLLPEKVSDLRYERRPTINLGLFGTVAPDNITWRPVTSANAYDLEWTYSWAGLDTTLKRYDISPECAPRCRSYLFRRPATESRFRVRASNAAGKGPWSDWSSIRPERPDQVTGLRHDLANKRLVWSRASGAATYVVRLWDGETGRNVEQDTCCSYEIDAKRDGITQVAVQAVNSGGRGPWSDWERTTQPPSHPRNVRAAQLDSDGIIVNWSAPTTSGSSSIAYYEVRYSEGSRKSNAWYKAPRPGHFRRELVEGATYKVEITAVNEDGRRSAPVSDTVTIVVPCPTGNKYETKNERFQPLTEHVHALQDFWLLKVTNDGRLVKDSRISKGTKGGEVETDYEEGMTNWNLKQSGCSWIDESSEVFDRAKVYDNARVEEDAHVFDDAKVYDNARVYDNATVRDHAQVYGDAEVWGGGTQIQHYARVKEDAKVWDGATVKDHARVYGDAKVSGGAVIAGSGDHRDDGGVYAEIYGKAKVSGEAVVDGNAEVYGNARVYGEASVSGNANVYGDARVFGEASVSGNAHVYGDAKVFGDAKVSGYARVFGTAKISDGMEVSCSLRLHDDVSGRLQYLSTSSLEALQPVHQECVYNGEFEVRRAALEVYFETRDKFVSTLTDCLNDSAEARRTTADLMAAPSNGVEIARQELGQEIVRGCSRLDEHRKIISEFTPGTVDIVVSYALGFGDTLRISTFTKSLIATADLANDLKSLSDAHAKLTAQIEKIREDPTKAELRRQLLGSGVVP